jgi:hypothetical protein
MISYSDYVLAERPWAYWPLSDPGLNILNQSQYLLDISGNNRHLTAAYSNKLLFQQDMPVAFHDSIPMTGVRIDESRNDVPMSSSIGEGSIIYLETGTNAHRNDVELEIIYGAHQLDRRRVRSEFIMLLPPRYANPPSGCGISHYPILSIGGMSMWMWSSWIKPCDDCACAYVKSWIVFAYATYKVWYRMDRNLLHAKIGQSCHLGPSNQRLDELWTIYHGMRIHQ